jgi:hypothetical protein
MFLCSTMKPLIAILTTLHVLAHGVFGCCDHGVTATARANLPCVCHHSSHEHSHSTTSHSDLVDEQHPTPAPHDCVHASCHWMTGDAAPTVNPLEASMPVAMTALVPFGSTTFQAAEFWPDVAAGTFSALPLRLHLSLGVILV